MTPSVEVTREIFWNVPMSGWLYGLFFPAALCFVYGMVRRVVSWRKGKAGVEGWRPLGRRLRVLLAELLLQRQVGRSRGPGLFHAFMFFPFLILLTTTTVIGLDVHFGTRLFRGGGYLVLTLLADLAGLVFLVGIGLAFWRRWREKPAFLTTQPLNYIVLVLLTAIVVTGFLVEGSRLARTEDPWSAFSPVGRLIGIGLSGLPRETGLNLHAFFWWLHAVLVLIWIAAIPFTPFLHLLAVPFNAFWQKTRPPGALARPDLEAVLAAEASELEQFTIGIDTSADLTWKQRLDLDACVACGRCEAVCPAFAAGLPLSPQRFIAGLKETVRRDELTAGADQQPTAIIGAAFDERFIWHCRTCRACDQVCPAFISHVDTHLDLRRSEVGMKSRLPGELMGMLRTLETRLNPFGAQSERNRWTKGLGVRLVGPGEHCQVLYWIGCLTTFDAARQSIAQDLLALLQDRGVDVGILGPAEFCCGDPARIAGEENLFQTIAKKQVTELQRRAFDTLLVSCPHCYNVLKNEYPQFGGHFNVIHHSQWLSGLLPKAPKPTADGKIVVFHDPCYLGRYQ